MRAFSHGATATMALLMSATLAHAHPIEFGGFYAGAHVAVTDIEAEFGGGGDLDGSGGFGGLQAGYNFLWGDIILGIETDISLAGVSLDGGCPYDAALSCDINIGPMATLRPRIGYALGDWMLFATGGVAAARIKVDSAGAGGPVDDVNGGSLGWTIGAGAEYLVGDIVGVKLEYRYLELGNFDFDAAGGPGDVDVDLNLHSLLAGINFHF